MINKYMFSVAMILSLLLSACAINPGTTLIGQVPPLVAENEIVSMGVGSTLGMIRDALRVPHVPATNIYRLGETSYYMITKIFIDPETKSEIGMAFLTLDVQAERVVSDITKMRANLGNATTITKFMKWCTTQGWVKVTDPQLIPAALSALGSTRSWLNTGASKIPIFMIVTPAMLNPEKYMQEITGNTEQNQ